MTKTNRNYLFIVYLALAILFTIVYRVKTNLFSTLLLGFAIVLGIYFAFIKNNQNNSINIVLYILIMLGICFQMTLNENIYISIFGLIFGVTCYFIIEKGMFQLDLKYSLLPIIYMSILLVLTCLILLAFGTSVNGTKAWIFVGGFSMQITEVIKVLTIILFCMIYANHLLSDFFKAQISLGLMILLSIFFVFINEIGTLALLWGVFICFVVLCFPLRIIAKVLFTMILLGCLAGIFIYFFYTMENVPASGLMLKFYNIAHKIMNRIELIGSSNLDRYGSGYQAYQSYRSLALSNLLSSFDNTYIPAGSTDYAFVLFTQKFGTIYALTFLGCCCLLGILSINMTHNNEFTSLLSTMATALLLIHIILSVLGCTGIIPLSGIGTPFLSCGGSQTVITCLLAHFIDSNTKEAV